MKKLVIVFLFASFILVANIGLFLSQNMQKQEEDFAIDIVENYNSLVYFYDLKEKDFLDYTNFYSLYLKDNKKLEISIIEDSADNCFYIEYKRISSNEYIIHFNDKGINDISPGVIVSCNDMNIISNNLYSGDSYKLSNFIFGVSNSHLDNNTFLSAKNAAEMIYDSDKESIRKRKINITLDDFLVQYGDRVFSDSILFQEYYNIYYKTYDEDYSYGEFLVDLEKLKLKVYVPSILTTPSSFWDINFSLIVSLIISILGIIFAIYLAPKNKKRELIKYFKPRV